MGDATTDRVALVTGGSRGIGHAIVKELLRDGWRVAFCSLSRPSVEAAAEELEAIHPGRVAGRAVDVRDQRRVDELVAWTVERFGRLDVLVANAGLGIFAPVDELDGDDWRNVVETNLSGVFYAIHAAAPVMKERGSGWILTIASLAGKHPFAGGAAYNASKFGLIGLTEAAMLDLRGHGIRVATILPGSVDTDFRPPGKRDDTSWMLSPADVARAVADLLRYPERALPSRVELRPSRPPGA